ncbi:MAG: TPM domain-containing protein [Flavobacteriales bacterium]|nr:TPM domain-containing protein [Flavobacteriales bacterium]MCB9334696.1 TPM domain-containing protein [Flavobacteriales bacterium]
MKKILSFIIFINLIAFTKAQDCLLEQPPVQDLVQDYANILSESEEQELRQALLAFNDSVSNQILIVTVTDLCGYDKAEFTYTLGQNWGVGQDGKDNGIVVMVKPKEIDGRGEAFIAPGYGLEGALPDAIAKRIVENEMIPSFKNQDYYEGIANAVVTIMEITGGEYTADEYAKGSFKKMIFPLLIVILMFGLVFFIKFKQARRYAHTNNLGFWAAWALLNSSGRSHGGSWSNFSSGSGSFGGGSSFGGFGGGSFGGGGAGGSW